MGATNNNKNAWFPSVLGAATSIGGTLLNQAFAEKNRERNFYYNEQAAKNADMRTRMLYQDLYSPAAQMKQLREAGLSPSLMYQNGGGNAGASGAQSAGLQGPYPSAQSLDPLTFAQIANIAANTEKTKAETLKIGADTEFTLTNIIKASEETENIKVTRQLLQLQSTGQQLQNEAKKLENEINSENKDEIIKQCKILSEKLQRESDQLYKENEALDLENNLSRETYQTRVNQYLADYKQTITLTAKAASDIELNEQQIQSLIDNVTINQFEARTRRISANEQIRQNDEIVKQWAIENGFTEQQIKNEKWKIAMSTITSIIDSGCKVAGAVISAK